MLRRLAPLALLVLPACAGRMGMALEAFDAAGVGGVTLAIDAEAPRTLSPRCISLPGGEAHAPNTPCTCTDERLSCATDGKVVLLCFHADAETWPTEDGRIGSCTMTNDTWQVGVRRDPATATPTAR